VTVERPLRRKGIDPERAYTPKEIKALREKAERAKGAPPVIKRIHKPGTAPDPLRGLFEATIHGKPRVVEYEPGTELRDSEQIPFLECSACHQPGYLPSPDDRQTAIETFLRREPYAPDAWYNPDSVKVGYEINFNRYFYKPRPCGLWKKYVQTFWQCRRRRKGCWMRFWGADRDDES
jgi:type I restriction enzyme M protein